MPNQFFTGQHSLITELDIELTERCNNACQHCYINLPENDVNAKNRELSTVEWKDILNQASDLGVLTVRMTGGEPLLREDFPELYLYARRLGMQVMLFTNARLLTPDLVDLFKKYPLLLPIEVTVYGMHADTYDQAACCPGAFVQFKRGIDLLLERNVPFVVKSALLPCNRVDVAEFEAWATKIPANDHSPFYAIFFDLRSRRDSAAKNKFIESLRLSPEEGTAFLARNHEAYFSEMQRFCSKFLHISGDRLFSCGAGGKPCVDAYGKLQLCMMVRHPDTVYDLKIGSLRDAVTQFIPEIRGLSARNPQYHNRCARCFLKSLCDQCPGKSWSEHGTLDTPVEYFCQIAHAQARHLGLLMEGENAWEVQDWQERINRMSQEKAVEARLI